MATPQTWLEVLAWTKALFDMITASENVYDAYERHKNERDTQQEARRVSTAFSTYSEQEINAMLDRLKGCRDRFIDQGGGRERAKCFCSVFKEIIEGNGGKLPLIDDWERMYATLGCWKQRDFGLG